MSLLSWAYPDETEEESLMAVEMATEGRGVAGYHTPLEPCLIMIFPVGSRLPSNSSRLMYISANNCKIHNPSFI